MNTSELVQRLLSAGIDDRLAAGELCLAAAVALEREKRRADDNAHCEDCCRARCWSALRVTEYTGKDIPTHIRELVAERDALQSRLDALRSALHRISLASQNSMSSQRECGRIARAAISADAEARPGAGDVPWPRADDSVDRARECRAAQFRLDAIEAMARYHRERVGNDMRDPADVDDAYSALLALILDGEKP